MDTPLSRAHNMIRSVINSGGTVSKYWIEDAMEVLAKDGHLTPLGADLTFCSDCGEVLPAHDTNCWRFAGISPNR